MPRPRILLVPGFTELEWRIKPALEEWAEVASYDAPGVGDEPASDEGDPRVLLERGVSREDRGGWRRCVVPGYDPVVERGLGELDRRGWERCVVVGDEFGALNAVGVAVAARERVEGLALGHACLSFRRSGPAAPVNGEVFAAFARLARFDYRTFARTLTQVTQGAYDENLAELYIERVPQELQSAGFELCDRFMDGVDVESDLRGLQVPLLLAEHRGCLMWTREGFKDAVRALAAAECASFEQKPSVSPDFAETLRGFAQHATRNAGEPAPRPG